jgi:NAD(P)-dependent dehydrogenase (short-subunit alcohol dehydrogenase family)
MNAPDKTLLVLGGTSDIGRATALAFAKNGWTVQLAGRDEEVLRREADDLSTRTGARVSTHRLDVLATGTFEAFADDLPVLPDTVVCVIGVLGEQRLAETNVDHATLVMRSNYEGPSLILGVFAERFVARGSGTIIGVSSVAGDRGRASNYLYGSAKSGFTAFLSGLRCRLAKRGVHVLTVKPGFVRTRMTQGLKLPTPLTADPKALGERIRQAAGARRNVIHSQLVWWPVMAIIRAIPEAVFKKLSM